MQINIKAKNAKLTAEAHEIIEESVRGLGKYFDNIINADVEVGLSSFHHQSGDIYCVEVNLQVPKKVISASAKTDTVSKSMTKVKNILKQKLVQYKETHHKDN
jgi:ribosomal subunit interface protein